MREEQRKLSVRVYVGSVRKRKLRRYITIFSKQGMSYNQTKHRFEMTVPDNTVNQEKINRIKHLAKRKHLRQEVIDAKYTRSPSCRNIFFASHEPDIGNWYFCIYCGRLLREEKVEVDHIIPVKKAETNRLVQPYFIRKNWNGINDIRNLGASCKRCNSKKSAKMGVWTIRGFVGCSKAFQFARCLIRMVIVMYGLWFFGRL